MDKDTNRQTDREIHYSKRAISRMYPFVGSRSNGCSSDQRPDIFSWLLWCNV